MKKKSDLLMFFLKGSKRFFGLAAVFAAVLVLFELVNPKIIGYTVDYIIGEEEAVPAFLLSLAAKLGGRKYVLHHLWIVAGMVVLIAILGGVCRYLFQLFNSMGANDWCRAAGINCTPISSACPISGTISTKPVILSSVVLLMWI